MVVINGGVPSAAVGILVMNSASTDAKPEDSAAGVESGVRQVDPAEFRALLVSPRRFERVNDLREGVRALRDLDSGELFLVDERGLLGATRGAVVSKAICYGSARLSKLNLEIRIALSLAESCNDGRFLVYPSQFTCQIEGADNLASSYHLENWEAGLISGALFALRQLGRPPESTRLLVREFSGRLRSEDLDIVARLATQCVASLCGRPLENVAYPEGWVCELRPK